MYRLVKNSSRHSLRPLGSFTSSNLVVGFCTLPVHEGFIVPAKTPLLIVQLNEGIEQRDKLTRSGLNLGSGYALLSLFVVEGSH
jgi:hypothetical protein